MKIKCFSKRKLNVRISKTKIKCAILGFSQNCCILGKSREKLVKFMKNSAKIQQILANFATFCKNQQKKFSNFLYIFTKKLRLERTVQSSSKSLASQEIRTKDIRLAVNSTKRNPDIVVVSQVYSQACHTAFILVRARGWYWVASCSCL